MRYLLSILMISAICCLLVPQQADAKLNIMTSLKAKLSGGQKDGSSESPGFADPQSIMKFLTGANMGSVCGYLKLPTTPVVGGMSLADLCGKILNCVVQIASQQDSRDDCGIKECYAAATNYLKPSSPLSGDKKKQMDIGDTVKSCSSLCKVLPANSKAQELCGVTKCYDDALALMANPSYAFPEYCCNIVSGKWGGNMGRAIEAYCSHSSLIDMAKCAAEWGVGKKLSGECCTSIDQLELTLGGDYKKAKTYCENGSAIAECKEGWDKDVANCNMLRSQGYACDPRPVAACCALMAVQNDNSYIKEYLDDIGVNSASSAIVTETCGDRPDVKQLINQDLCASDPAYCIR